MDKKKTEHLYKTHYARLFRLAHGVLGDEEDSRDAVNEAFSRLISADVEVEDGDELRFLTACVRNVCLNAVKHKSVRERFARMCFTSDGDDFGDEEYWKDAADEVMSIVNGKFTERMKRVFMLRFAGGLKYEEIATELGIARMTVYKDLFKGVDLVKMLIKR